MNRSNWRASPSTILEKHARLSTNICKMSLAWFTNAHNRSSTSEKMAKFVPGARRPGRPAHGISRLIPEVREHEMVKSSVRDTRRAVIRIIRVGGVLDH